MTTATEPITRWPPMTLSNAQAVRLLTEGRVSEPRLVDGDVCWPIPGGLFLWQRIEGENTLRWELSIEELEA